MPITLTRKLHPTGDKRGSRALIIPKEWWSSGKFPVKNVTMSLDKVAVMSPEAMKDDEIVECVLFILKQQFTKEQVSKIFQRVFDIEIIETSE